MSQAAITPLAASTSAAVLQSTGHAMGNSTSGRNMLAAIVAGLLIVGGWIVFERIVAGAGYRWTTWAEIADPTIGKDDDRFPSPDYARFLDGKKISDCWAAKDLICWMGWANSPKRLVPVIRMPAREDMLPGAPYLVLRQQTPFDHGDSWRVARVWGTLRVAASSRSDPPATLELQVDRIGEDPRYVPDAIAPTRPVDWLIWGIGLLVRRDFLVAIILMHIVRLLLGVRLIGRTAAVLSLITALRAMIIAVIVSAPIGRSRYPFRHDVHRHRHIARSSRDFLAPNYRRAAPTEYRWYIGSSDHDFEAVPTRAGLGFRSWYTRYDWGDVHAHWKIAIAWPWMIVSFATPRCSRGGFRDLVRTPPGYAHNVATTR